MADILVVDDQAEMRSLIRDVLEREGHDVRECETASAAVEAVSQHRFDLVLLDIDLPDASGYDVLADLVDDAQVPVIFVSGRGRETDRVLGLRMGADDYISKPFSVHELAARVAVALRRTRRSGAKEELVFGDLRIKPLEREARVGDTEVEMTTREFELLLHLAQNPNRVFTRDELLREVWRSQAGWQDAATVTEHVRRLRNKIEADPAHPRWIQTVRGAGYRFAS